MASLKYNIEPAGSGTPPQASLRTLEIPARDGYTLSATVFTPPDGHVRAAVLLNSGTAIPQRFYKGFASFLATRGFLTMTWDYRGIGDSAPQKLAGFEATKGDWGRLDMSGAFSALERLAPDVPTIVVGHSVGGQLLGLMDCVDQIDAVVTFGSGFGYWGNIAGRQKYLALALWYVGIPVGTRLFGYMPASRLGLGEDLPSGVARDWARWGKRAHYFTRELADEHGFQNLDVPWKAYIAEDDEVATDGNAAPLHAFYGAANIDVEKLDPSTFGYDSIGHLGYFSRRRKAVWRRAAKWMQAQAPR